MTMPTIDGLHYVGCHCNDVCACSDPIECIHEQCICDRLSAAYQRGREDADRWCNVADTAYRKGREDAAKAVEVALGDYVYGEDFGPPEFRIVAAARGDGEQA